MSDKILTSIIGAGEHAKHWAQVLQNDSRYKLKSVSSRNKDLGLKFAEENSCKYFLSTDDILNDKSINLVIFSSDPERQVLAVQFANAKKNLILEKPLSLNLKDTEIIYNACKKNKIFCGAGLNRYYDTFLPMLKKDLTNYLGKCFYGEYKIFLKGHSSDRHFSKDFINKKGDIIIGSLVHNFDQINSVFGKPKSLMANRVKANLEGILLHANVLVSYKDNILINFSIKNDCENDYGQEIILYCEKGIAHINFNLNTVSFNLNPLNTNFSKSIFSKFKYNFIKNKRFYKFERKKTLVTKSFQIGGQKDILNSFANKLSGKKDSDLVNIENNYISTLMAFACYDSIKNNKWVSI
tara:strand:- start:517 stop:1575 length:1059 start_codon:yes stop_codon:yes gene_type:complete